MADLFHSCGCVWFGASRCCQSHCTGLPVQCLHCVARHSWLAKYPKPMNWTSACVEWKVLSSETSVQEAGIMSSQKMHLALADYFEVWERIWVNQFTTLSLSQGELLPTVLSLQPERVCSAVTVSLSRLDLYIFFNDESVLETMFAHDSTCSHQVPSVQGSTLFVRDSVLSFFSQLFMISMTWL